MPLSANTYKTAAVFVVGFAAGPLVKSFFYDNPSVSKKIKETWKTVEGYLDIFFENFKFHHLCSIALLAGGAVLYKRMGRLETSVSMRIGDLETTLTNRIINLAKNMSSSIGQNLQKNLSHEIKNTITQVLSRR